MSKLQSVLVGIRVCPSPKANRPGVRLPLSGSSAEIQQPVIPEKVGDNLSAAFPLTAAQKEGPPLHEVLWAVAHHARHHACGQSQAIPNGLISALRCRKPLAFCIHTQCPFAVPKHEWYRLFFCGLLFTLRCHHLQQPIHTNRVSPITLQPCQPFVG